MKGKRRAENKDSSEMEVHNGPHSQKTDGILVGWERFVVQILQDPTGLVGVWVTIPPCSELSFEIYKRKYTLPMLMML